MSKRILSFGRVEDPVQRDGQLDHAEVGAEVPAGLGDLVDEEGADLLGQLVQLLLGERLEGGRARDVLEQGHAAVLSLWVGRSSLG